MKQWKKIAEGSAGIPYGHTPGHQFSDVTVVILRRGTRWLVEVKEERGSDQGSHDEIHKRREVSIFGGHLPTALWQAKEECIALGMDREHLTGAIARAQRKAVGAAA